MSDGTVLRELTRSLSEKERKELLDKINKSISIREESENSIYPKEMNEEERDILINHDMEIAPFPMRFLLWLKKLFSNKSKKELFITLKLNSLKKSIQRRNPGLTGFESRDLTPKTAQEFFNLYVVVNPLIPLFRKMWKNSSGLENALMKLIERRIPEAKSKLFDLVTQSEMEEIYNEKGAKDKIREVINKKIDRYVNSIPDGVFVDLENQIKPIYYLKEIVLYPYHPFFDLFHFSPQPTDEKPVFKSASAVLSLEFLEKMVYAIYTAMKIELPLQTDSEFASDLLNSTLKTEKVSEDKEVLEKTEPETDREEADRRQTESEESNDLSDSNESSELSEPSKSDEKIEELESEEQNEIHQETEKEAASIKNGELLLKTLERVAKSVRKFSRDMPIVELIRYFKADPYYQLIFYIPKLMLKDFYHSFLKIKLFPEFDSVFPEIRKTVIEKKIDELFQGKRLTGFLHYRDYTSIDFESIGLPKFKHTRSISLLYNFLKVYYRKSVQETIQILSRGLLKQNRITLNRLLLHAASIEDLEEKIQLFDVSLSPDEEDGKLFQRIRHSLSTDSTHQRLYRNLINQKDKEAEAFIQKGKESFLGVKKIFDELLASPMESMKEKLNILFTVGGKALTLGTLLRSQSDQIAKFYNLLNQMSRIEAGS